MPLVIPPSTLGPTQILQALAIAAIMGMVGQGIRAVIGLKSSATLAAQSGTQQSEFDAAYFALSLMIGAIAGVIAAFGIGFESLLTTLKTDQKLLLAIAASGYAGADFIENAMTNILPKASVPKKSESDAANAGTASKDSEAQPTAVSVRQQAQAALTLLNAMQTALDTLGASPLVLLHRAADGSAPLQDQLNAAVTAWATLTTCVTQSRSLIPTVQALAGLANDAKPDVLKSSGQAAADSMEKVSALNNDFSAALATFKKTYDEILRATAKG